MLVFHFSNTRWYVVIFEMKIDVRHYLYLMLFVDLSTTSMEASLNVPLECQFSKDFGDLDEEQELLVATGALDLVLMENAAELVRRVMMDGDNIEAVLRVLSRANRGCSVLPHRNTFPT